MPKLHLKSASLRSLVAICALLVCGCPTVPASQAVAPPEAQPPTLSAPAPTASASDGGVGEAMSASIQALMRCDRVVLAIPSQQLSVKKGAYNRKQGGLLLTTAVGVAGSILTAVLANTQKNAAGAVDPEPATIVGASTAGATTVAGVISLFVVGVGADDRLQQMDSTRTQVEGRIASYKTTCGAITTDNATTCKNDARLLEGFCDSSAKTLPYAVP